MTQPDANGVSPVKDRRRELEREKLGSLRKKTHDMGVGDDECDDALNCDDPKAAVIELIMKRDEAEDADLKAALEHAKCIEVAVQRFLAGDTAADHDDNDGETTKQGMDGRVEDNREGSIDNAIRAPSCCRTSIRVGEADGLLLGTGNTSGSSATDADAPADSASDIDLDDAQEILNNMMSEEITTLMIRNMPARLKQGDLVTQLDADGFAGTYDWLYMPSIVAVKSSAKASVKTKGRTKGYAFVNFITPEFAVLFKAKWHGQKRWGMNGKNSLNLTVSTIQGKEKNKEHFMRGKSESGKSKWTVVSFPHEVEPDPIDFGRQQILVQRPWNPTTLNGEAAGLEGAGDEKPSAPTDAGYPTSDAVAAAEAAGESGSKSCSALLTE